MNFNITTAIQNQWLKNGWGGGAEPPHNVKVLYKTAIVVQ